MNKSEQGQKLVHRAEILSSLRRVQNDDGTHSWAFVVDGKNYLVPGDAVVDGMSLNEAYPLVREARAE